MPRQGQTGSRSAMLVNAGARDASLNASERILLEAQSSYLAHVRSICLYCPSKFDL